MQYLLLLSVTLLQVVDNTLPIIVDEVLLTTQYGKILGRRQLNLYDVSESKVSDIVDRYLGIPYAAPPTGDNRFQVSHTT